MRRDFLRSAFFSRRRGDKCLPVLAPAQAFLRAGERRGFRLRRCSALARRSDIPHCESVNCAPAKGCVWPDIGRHRRLCARGSGGAAVWFCWGVLRLDCVCHALLLECFAFDHACYTFLLERFAFGLRLSLFLCQEKRDGLRHLAFLFRGSRSPFVRSRGALRLSAFVGSLRVWLFLYGDLDGVTTGVGYTKRNAVFVQRSFCYKFMIRNDTAGSPLGAARPQTCAKESSTLWTLFI